MVSDSRPVIHEAVVDTRGTGGSVPSDPKPTAATSMAAPPVKDDQDDSRKRKELDDDSLSRGRDDEENPSKHPRRSRSHSRGSNGSASSGASETDPSKRKNSEGLYECQHCFQTYTRQHNLKSHLLTHSHEKPFRCDVCDAKFRRLHDLKRHGKLHTGERPHVCDRCGRGFARADALVRHVKGSGPCSASNGDARMVSGGRLALPLPLRSHGELQALRPSLIGPSFFDSRHTVQATVPPPPPPPPPPAASILPPPQQQQQQQPKQPQQQGPVLPVPANFNQNIYPPVPKPMQPAASTAKYYYYPTPGQPAPPPPPPPPQSSQLQQQRRQSVVSPQDQLPPVLVPQKNVSQVNPHSQPQQHNGNNGSANQSPQVDESAWSTVRMLEARVRVMEERLYVAEGRVSLLENQLASERKQNGQSAGGAHHHLNHTAHHPLQQGV